MLQGCLPYVEELTSWMEMILVDGYQDDMLSRTTTILGGGGCKDLEFDGCAVNEGAGRVDGRAVNKGTGDGRTGARASAGARVGAR